MAQNLNSNRSDNRGGSRKNAGRKSVGNVQYQRRIPAEFVPEMDEYLEKLKAAKL